MHVTRWEARWDEATEEWPGSERIAAALAEAEGQGETVRYPEGEVDLDPADPELVFEWWDARQRADGHEPAVLLAWEFTGGEPTPEPGYAR